MKKNIFAGLMAAGFAMAISFAPSAFAIGGSLNGVGTVSDSATVSMEVGKFAAITQLDDFVLSTSDADGSEGAVYSGSDTFRLITNAAVHVILEGSNLVNGSNSVATTYALDAGGLSFDTTVGVHNAEHTVSASATLGEISAQEAGSYSAEITITVAAL